MELTYIVYVYNFEDGKKYIGRSRTDQKRFGYVDEYKNQYVHRMLTSQNFTKEILLETTNVFLAYKVESELIKILWEDLYNAKKEDNWFSEALKTLSTAKANCDIDELEALVEEYKGWWVDAEIKDKNGVYQTYHLKESEYEDDEDE